MTEKETKSSETPPEFDFELLMRNIELSYEERLIEHQRALDLLLALQQAGKDFYAKQSE